jgi:two-component sensor histidine kinase
MEPEIMSNVVALDEFRRVSTEFLNESDHRIANHLSTVVAMIQTQMVALRKGPAMLPRERASDVLREATIKILAIAHLHRQLAGAPRTGAINLGNLLIEIVDEIVASLTTGERLHVSHKLGTKCTVDADQASTLVLIASEILMNAVKYAHPTNVPIEMSITCSQGVDGRTVLEISDDGVGLPEGFDTARDGGFGFRLIRNLAKRIGAELTIESDDLGLSFRFNLPAKVDTPIAG